MGKGKEKKSQRTVSLHTDGGWCAGVLSGISQVESANHLLAILSLPSSPSPSHPSPAHSPDWPRPPMYHSLHPRFSVQDFHRAQGGIRPLPDLNEAEWRFSERYLDLFFSVSKWETCCCLKSFAKARETKQCPTPPFCKVPGAHTLSKPECVSCYCLYHLVKEPKMHTFLTTQVNTDTLEKEI